MPPIQHLELALGIGAKNAVTSDAARKPQEQQLTPERLRTILTQLHEKHMDALTMYQSLPEGERFHACSAKWRLAYGGNRSGKTNCVAAEFARAVLGCDPYDKYPATSGNALIVGMDADHLSLQWKKVAEEGCFYIIRDEHTRLWRAVRPHPDDPTRLDDYDEAYREQWKPAPPLIPWHGKHKRVTKIAWEDYGKGVPRLVKFDTGWTSLWRSSEGKPPKGHHWNVFWPDEDLQNDDFWEEGNRGLVGLNEPPKWLPKGIWSASEQGSNTKLLSLIEQAEAGSDNVKSFFFVVDNNPYVPEAERRAWYESMTEDEREYRYHGRPVARGRSVYPMYQPQTIHGCEPTDVPVESTRYLYVDPANTLAGTLMLAVDKQERHRWVYNCFVIKLLKGRTVQDWAAEVADRSGGIAYQAAVIDQQAGKCRQYGGDISTASLWWQALMDAGVKVLDFGGLAGSGFFAGCNDVAARQIALQNWLLPRPSGDFAGLPLAQVVRGLSPELDAQIQHARMLSVKPNQRTKRIEKRAELVEDLLDCFEYAAAHDPGYVPPRLSIEEKGDEIYDLYEQMCRKTRQRSACLVG